MAGSSSAPSTGKALGVSGSSHRRGRALLPGTRPYSADEMKDLLSRTDGGPMTIHQTVFGDPGGMTAPSPVIEGHGKALRGHFHRAQPIKGARSGHCSNIIVQGPVRLARRKDYQ